MLPPVWSYILTEKGQKKNKKEQKATDKEKEKKQRRKEVERNGEEVDSEEVGERVVFLGLNWPTQRGRCDVLP